MTTPTLVERLRGLLAKTTQRPWFDTPYRFSVGVTTKRNGRYADLVAECYQWDNSSVRPNRETTLANAALIVEAVNSLPTLLDTIERLEAALRAIEEGTIERPLGKVYRADGVRSKHDLCVHNVYMYQVCEACISAHVRDALGG